ncbi:MAG: hypothetical protein U0325_09690 [Polyangiales bacterium]
MRAPSRCSACWPRRAARGSDLAGGAADAAAPALDAADGATRPDAPAASDASDATDVRPPVDRATPEDAPPGGCVRASQCGDRPFSTMTFATGWSCIAGRCVWELAAGRTCVRAPDGCIDCDREPRRTCPGAPCTGTLARDGIRLERAYCARDFFAGVRACAGGFVTLDDQVCTLSYAPTGAIRFVLACGPCEVVFTPR